jgi:glucose-1-phosphatase
MAIRAVWFDLGGVLVELGAEDHLRSVMGDRFDSQTFWPRWMASAAVRAHETGRMPAADFAAAIAREFDMAVSPEEFLAGFGSWVRGVHDGSLELLHEVGQRHQTALLSNTCQAHWPIIEATGIPQAIHHVMASFTVGEIKPDRAFFEKVMKTTDTAANEAVFFDDILINVEAARACGLTAFQVRHPTEARKHLVELGLLP